MDTSSDPLIVAADSDDSAQDSSLSSDPRHQRRAELMQQLFAWSFDANSVDQEITELQAVIPELPGIDAQLQTAAPGDHSKISTK